MEFIQYAVAALPSSAFTPGQGHGEAILAQLAKIESQLAKGRTADAIEKLRQLRRHLDGCGSAADRNDWIDDCAAQNDDPRAGRPFAREPG